MLAYFSSLVSMQRKDMSLSTQSEKWLKAFWALSSELGCYCRVLAAGTSTSVVVSDSRKESTTRK